jgi:hypothetical protein
MLSCRQYEESGGDLAALRSESELAFAPHSRNSYSLADDVVLELHTKNIGTEVGACRQALHFPHIYQDSVLRASVKTDFLLASGALPLQE